MTGEEFHFGFSRVLDDETIEWENRIRIALRDQNVIKKGAYFDVLVDLVVEVDQQDDGDETGDNDASPTVVVNGVGRVFAQFRHVNFGDHGPIGFLNQHYPRFKEFGQVENDTGNTSGYGELQEST